MWSVFRLDNKFFSFIVEICCEIIVKIVFGVIVLIVISVSVNGLDNVVYGCNGCDSNGFFGDFFIIGVVSD